MELGNGETLSSSFDTLYRTDLTGVGTLYQRDYEYQANSQIKAITDPLGSKDHTYTYDQLSQLDLATGPYGTMDFDHDNVGNRELLTVNSTDMISYTYETGTNKIDQVTGIGTVDYTLDNAGLLTNKSTDNTVYTWTDDQRLETVSKNSSLVATYKYDGRGLRTVKTVNGQTTLFVYDNNGRLLAEADDQGNITREYVYIGDRIFAHFQYGVQTPAPAQELTGIQAVPVDTQPLIADTAPPKPDNSISSLSGANSDNIAFLVSVYHLLLFNKKQPAEGAYYYITDHLNAPQIITDDTGTVVWQADYRPFGEVNIPVEQIENNLRFAGQYYDAETGFYYNWNRIYDPGKGGYISADPIGLGGGINLFAYVLNDPVNWVDPWGLEANPFALGGEHEPDQWGDEAHRGLKDFLDNYRNMRDASTIGADKYFHCMANCQAAKEGDGGYATAVSISDARERTDLIRKGNTPQQRRDSASDRAANRQGRNFDPCKTCKQQCNSLRPRGLDPKY